MQEDILRLSNMTLKPRHYHQLIQVTLHVCKLLIKCILSVFWQSRKPGTTQRLPYIFTQLYIYRLLYTTWFFFRIQLYERHLGQILKDKTVKQRISISKKQATLCCGYIDFISSVKHNITRNEVSNDTKLHGALT